jgi:hypothetical protein
MTTLVRAAARAGLAALPHTPLPAGSAVPDDDVTWAVRTASNDFGADRTSFRYGVDPGTAVQDALVVVNRGDEPLELGVYAADGYTTDSGQFDLLTSELPSTGVGAWVHTDSGTVDVPAGASVAVPFTVTVPDDATPGDYAGGIVTTLTQPDDAQGITVDRRLGIRVALRVGGELAPSLAIEQVHLSYGGSLNPFALGDATLTYTIHNTGNALMSAQQATTVAGPFGWFSAAAPTVDAPPQLLPGERWTVTVPVRDVVPALRLAATATVAPLVTDASGSTTSLAPLTVTAHTWAVPWALLLLVAVLVALVVGTVITLRRRRARRQVLEDQRVQEAVELALRDRETSAS